MGVVVPLGAIVEVIIDGASVALDAAQGTLLIALFEGCSFVDSSRLRFRDQGAISLVGVLTVEDGVAFDGTNAGMDSG